MKEKNRDRGMPGCRGAGVPGCRGEGVIVSFTRSPVHPFTRSPPHPYISISSIRSQAGYALIATIGALTVMLILITGILPSVAQEVQREREAEMLFRGRQIVGALVQYNQLCQRFPAACQSGGVRWGNVVYPRSLRELAEGINLRTTSRARLLRPSVLKDPMNKNGPWKTVGFGDPVLEEYLDAYFEYTGRVMAPQIRQMYVGTTIHLNQDESNQDRQNRRRSPLGGGSDQPSFIFGVVSESKDHPLRDYYGLERYDQWVFAYLLGLPFATGDKQVQMLTREISFPSDPLSFIQFGGGAMRNVVTPPGPAVSPPGNPRNQPGNNPPTPQQ